MQRVYSNQFLITKEGVDGRKVLGDVVTDCKAWIADSVKRQTGDELAMAGWEKGVTTPHGARVKLDLRDTPNSLWAEVLYEHGSPDDPDRRWRTRMRLGYYQHVLEFQIDIFTGFTTSVLRPPVKDGGQPRIVRILASKYHCIRAGAQLDEKAQRVSTNSVPGLIERIRDPRRRLPILLLAPNEERRYLIMPDKLQSRLLGIAEVEYFRDEHAAAAFNAVVRDPWHVFDGAFRIFWPRADEKDPFANPLYTPSRLFREGVTEEQLVESYICRVLYGVAVTMNVDSAVVDGAWQLAEQERRDKALALNTVKDLREAVSRHDDAIKGYVLAIQEKNDRINYLEAELSRSQRRAPAEPERVDFAAAIRQSKTAGEVVEIADQAFDRLIMHPRAIKCSDGYKSRHLDDLWLALEVLNDVAGQYKDNGSLGQPFADACKEAAQKRGKKLPKLAIGDSETNLTQFAHERTVEFEGEELLLGQHFTLGKADPEGCIHLFFEPFPKRNEILVGYVGPHLSYASM